jgi:hypothetical protein
MSIYEEKQELRHMADYVAEQAGAFHPCEWHEEIMLSNQDDESERMAYGIGTNKIKNGEIDADREEFMALIKEAISEAAWDCPRCQAMEDS